MFKKIAMIGLVLFTVTMGACSSTCSSDRSTASEEDKVDVYKPKSAVERHL